MKVKDKVIIITGAGSGRELALNVLTKGAEVITLDISHSRN
jgi:NAD(P)-dependent dehydrogenase (short-subunit alcohol dehydrogenase family)